MRRMVLIVVAAALALSLSAGGAGGAKQKPPKTGIYGAIPKTKKGDVSYKPGVWMLVKDGGKLQMIRYPEYSAIFWPEPPDGCNPYTIGLTAESVPVSKTGRFHAKEKIPISGTDETLSVDWKGRWTKPTKLKGTVKLGLGNCHETVPYTGSRNGPLPAG